MYVSEQFERIVYCPLSTVQVAVHELFRDIVGRKYDAKTHRLAEPDLDYVRGLSEERFKMQKPLSNFNNVLMQLRKLCNHPYLVLNQMRHIPDELYFAQMVQLSGKLAVLSKILPHLLAVGSKVCDDTLLVNFWRQARSNTM